MIYHLDKLYTYIWVFIRTHLHKPAGLSRVTSKLSTLALLLKNICYNITFPLGRSGKSWYWRCKSQAWSHPVSCLFYHFSLWLFQWLLFVECENTPLNLLPPDLEKHWFTSGLFLWVNNQKYYLFASYAMYKTVKGKVLRLVSWSPITITLSAKKSAQRKRKKLRAQGEAGEIEEQSVDQLGANWAMTGQLRVTRKMVKGQPYNCD